MGTTGGLSFDPDALRARVEESIATAEPTFGRFFLLRLLGLEVSYTDDTCSVRLPVDGWMHNPHGMLHGGIAATVIDVSMGHLLNHLGVRAVTSDLHVSYHRPIPGDAVVATARAIKVGRTIVHMSSEIRDSEGRVCSSAVATFVRLDGGGVAS